VFGVSIERIAFAGDWHGNTWWARDMIDHASAQGAQAIVHLGDYGYRFTREFREQIEGALDAHDMRLYFVDGNHEDFPWLYSQPIDGRGRRPITPHVFHLPRGYRWEWGGVRFLAMGGAHSVDRPYREPGREWWPEETITPREVAEAVKGGPADVVVSHDCPTGVVIPGIDDRRPPSWITPNELARANAHRSRLRRLVDKVQPSMIWHGHYHERHETIADLGYGPVVVTGLAHDETNEEANIAVVDVADLLVRS
jgi:predicted phosphodiesterase